MSTELATRPALPRSTAEFRFRPEPFQPSPDPAPPLVTVSSTVGSNAAAPSSRGAPQAAGALLLTVAAALLICGYAGGFFATSEADAAVPAAPIATARRAHGEATVATQQSGPAKAAPAAATPAAATTGEPDPAEAANDPSELAVASRDIHELRAEIAAAREELSQLRGYASAVAASIQRVDFLTSSPSHLQERAAGLAKAAVQQ